MYNYEISKDGEILTFSRDHGENYGGNRVTKIDCENKTGRKLYNHIKRHLGKAMATAARLEDFC